jgi:hypothetical protein
MRQHDTLRNEANQRCKHQHSPRRGLYLLTLLGRQIVEKRLQTAPKKLLRHPIHFQVELR